MTSIPSEPQADPADVTMVIITRDRCDSLKRTLDHVIGLPQVREVIVVDNATERCDVAAVCGQYESVRLISLDRNHGAAARNIGVDDASTPYVAFCDDDSWWAQDAIPRARAHFERYPDLGLIAGRVLVGPEERLDPVSAAQSKSPLPRNVPMPGPAILGFLACAVVVRTAAFREAGGYSPLLGVGGEEALLAIDLITSGWALSYADDVVAHHCPVPRRKGGARQAIQARNIIWVAWMRRRWSSALRISFREVLHCVSNPCVCRGIVDAGRGLPRVLGRRRPVPPWLEGQLRLLESDADRA